MLNKIKQKILSTIAKITQWFALRKVAKGTLDDNARRLRRQIKVATPAQFNTIRRNLIEAIEKDAVILVAEGKTDKEILQPCLDSPNYMALLGETGLGIEHLKVAISSARRHRNIKKAMRKVKKARARR